MSEKIDKNLDLLLKVAGSSLKNYEERTKENLRRVMRTIMSESYIKGSNDCERILKDGGTVNPYSDYETGRPLHEKQRI